MSHHQLPDVHVLFASRAITKARNAFRDGGGSASGGGGTGSAGGGAGGGTPLSSSLSRSPATAGFAPSAIANAIAAELNRPDELGRTVLHKAVEKEATMDWVELLVGIAGCAINRADKESGWTALHRALYAGNLGAARLLLGRSDVDVKIKDYEGLTAFDVYNSTVSATNPSDLPLSAPGTTYSPPRLELFTWGSNRNFILGLYGDSDRSSPEKVTLKRSEESARRLRKAERPGWEVWEPVRVKEVRMARLHSALITDEHTTAVAGGGRNLRLCGYGTAGRLGPSTKSAQFAFELLETDFYSPVVAVALSPDHTVVVTAAGACWSFGLNRFSQLGYVLDAPASTTEQKGTLASGRPARDEGDAIQAAPRRVVHGIKKLEALGCAASRTHSAAYCSDGSLWTWGTNRGQLGYAAASQGGEAVQVLPRKVTVAPFGGAAGGQPAITQLSATEGATAVLFETGELWLLVASGAVKVLFPLARFPSSMETYRPPQEASKPSIVRVESCGTSFAALGSLGDVFQFSLPEGAAAGGPAGERIKPARIWSLRRKFTGVTDLAVGMDGAVIICTVSGHVFVRARKYEAFSADRSAVSNLLGATPKGSGGFKWTRVMGLQRIVKVAANSTGAYAAIRSDVASREVDIEGRGVEEDLLGVLPHYLRTEGALEALRARDAPATARRTEDDDEEEEEEEAAVRYDIWMVERLVAALAEWDEEDAEHSGGTDMHLEAGGLRVPVHRAIITARLPTAVALISEDDAVLRLAGASPLAALLFTHYVYSDTLLTPWDPRVRLGATSAAVKKLNSAALKIELQVLAQSLSLPELAAALASHTKRAPAPTLGRDLALLRGDQAACDVLLELAGGEAIRAHSVVLRARCDFFAEFYEDEEWTARRLAGGVRELKVDLKHWERNVMELVVRHIYEDTDIELFAKIERDTVDAYIDFVFLVMAAANELLLDKLKLVCSAVLQKFISLQTVCSILVDAVYYEAQELSNTAMRYLASSMETVLELRLLDDLPTDVLSALSAYCQGLQGTRMPISRSQILITPLMEKHATWLAEQDLPRQTGGARKYRPTPLHLSSSRNGPSPSMLSPTASPLLKPSSLPKSGTMLSPPNSTPRMQPTAVPTTVSPGPSPNLPPLREDTPFEMDEDFALDSGPPPSSTNPTRRTSYALGSPSPSRHPGQPWKSPTLESRTAGLDLRSIMASEAAAERKTVARPTSTPGSARRDSSSGWSVPTSGTPWQTSVAAAPSTSVPKGVSTVPFPTLSATAQPFVRAMSSSPKPAPAPFRPATTSASTSSPNLVFTPTKHPARNQSGSGGGAGKGSFGLADVPWTNYAPYTPSPPSSSPILSKVSTSPASTSFHHIQAEQIAFNAHVRTHKTSRPSLSSVMKAEEDERKAKSEEEEFLRWWAAEEKRVQREQEALATSSTPASAARKTTRKPTTQGGGSSRGRGTDGPPRGGGSSRGRGKGRANVAPP